MAQYISKSALVAEIQGYISGYKDILSKVDKKCLEYAEGIEAKIDILQHLLSFINTLEVKEVEEMYERPTIKIEDDISVISRLQHIDADLKPIADFIIDYASWNLHKDEWNQPVLEVPLFRVLDALVQRGKPYCEG